MFITCSKTAIEGFSNCEKVNGLNFSQTVAMRKQDKKNVRMWIYCGYFQIFHPRKMKVIQCRQMQKREYWTSVGSWWIFNAGPVLSCNVDIGEKSSITSKIILSSVKKRYYFRLATILISCWSLEAEGKVLKKSGHCDSKTCPKKQFVLFIFFIYHNWSSLIKLLQPFINDTKEFQLHLFKSKRISPLSPLKCWPRILYCYS